MNAGPPSKRAQPRQPGARPRRRPRFETLAIHAGQSPEPVTGAVMTPIFLTSTYAQKGPGEHKGFEYSRTQNPTRFALEANLAALEGGAWGLAFNAGLAASTAVLSLLDAGDHVVAGDDLYGGTFRLFDKVFQPPRADLHLRRRARSRPPSPRPSARARKLCWIETPTNPLLRLADIRARRRASAARAAFRLCVDNTFMTPYFQRPLELGADLVVHSTTKYLNGHSDVVGGAIIGRDAAAARAPRLPPERHGRQPAGVRQLPGAARDQDARRAHGAAPAERAAPSRAGWSTRREVERVIYPGLRRIPQHALARRQMSGFGGMVELRPARRGPRHPAPRRQPS